MRQFVLLAAAAALVSAGTAQAAETYVESPRALPGLVPPPAGTIEYGLDTFFNSYVVETSPHGRTIANGGPLLDLSGVPGPKQIQASFPVNAGPSAALRGGDVDLFQVSVTQPDDFQAWTGRTVDPLNNVLLTLFTSDGTAVVASLSAARILSPANTIAGSQPQNPNDPNIIKGLGLPGFTAGNYYLGLSVFEPTTGKGQPKNDAGENLFNLVQGSVVLANPLADKKLSTDPLKAWDLYSLDTGTIGSFDVTTGGGNGDRLLGTSASTLANANINLILVPEPAAGLAMGLAALATLARRRRA